jgi:LuxR family maltose regulon positive regulatory protein
MPIDFGNPLIATKLYIPPARLGRVDRARLIERMKASVNHPLTLICAPAGYGKTTLLSEWIPQNEHCVTWLSLDEGDNDPVRFWRYFIAALQTLNPELGKNAQLLLESSQAPPIETVLSLAINDMAAQDYEFSHVIDDYHLIDNPAIDESLTYLIEHLPSNVNLVIATRRDPALPLARWRARGQLEEIRSADLRFTKGEVTAFFNQSMKLDLSAPEIAALETRTEGWVAGLQLVALSIKDQDDRSRFIAAFTGSHRFIVD